MSDKIYLDPGDLYEKAADAAECALSVSACGGYGLEDIAEEETLTAAFGNALLGSLLIEGTLTGCLAALSHVQNAAAPPLSGNASGPQGTAVNAGDLQHAHAILATALSNQLDESQRSALIRAELEHGYLGDPARSSSIVLVTLSDEIIHHAN